MMPDPKAVKIRKIAAAKTLRKLLADHFHELDRAVKAGQPKVAWWPACRTRAPGASPSTPSPTDSTVPTLA